jgi:hypothetical protein
MAKMAKLAKDLAVKFGEGIHPIKISKRFLDDILIYMIFLLDALNTINSLNKVHIGE